MYKFRNVAGGHRAKYRMVGLTTFFTVTILSQLFHSMNAQLLQVPNNMVIIQQPEFAQGGSFFGQQPHVILVDENGDRVRTANTTFEGKIVEALFFVKGEPTATLRQNGTLDNVAPTAVIVDGYANFTGLWIDLVGPNYQLQFRSYAIGASADPFLATTEPFNVTTGGAVRLSMHVSSWNALGGTPFQPQPEVTVLDAGGNIVTSDNTHIITAEICYANAYGCTDPNTGGQLMTIGATSSLQVQLVKGKAIFSGLAIDREGSYRMLFSINSVIPTPYVVSNAFIVGVGGATNIEFEQTIQGARGGMVFAQNPRLSLRDAGGNLVTEDSVYPPHSQIKLELRNNPSGAVLSSEEFPLLERGMENGYANFTDLKVDVIGQDYYIFITAHLRTISGQLYIVYGQSDPFDVSLGESSELEVVRGIGGAWAGGQPFLVQPVLQLRDAGRNLMVIDSDTVVEAVLVDGPEGQSFPFGGTVREVADLGFVRFKDLSMVQRGENYVVEYRASGIGGNFTANETFTVVPSTEFEVMASDVEPNDHMGFAVSLFEEVMVAGAPREDTPVKEVQRVSTFASTSVARTEIQTITTSGSHRSEIQQILLCGEGGTTTSLAGHFTVSWNGFGPTRPLSFDVSNTAMEAYLESDIPELGQVSVVVSRHRQCDTLGTFMWSVVFDSLEGHVPLLEVNTRGVASPSFPSGLTFDGVTGMEYASTAVNVSAIVTRQQESPYLSGTFQLLVGADGSVKGDGFRNATRPIPHDASEEELKLAIEEAMPIPAGSLSNGGSFELVSVTRSGPDGQEGYTWRVEFSNVDQYFDYLQLEPEYQGSLLGLNPRMLVRTERQGTAPIRGSFQLWFKGIGPSPAIQWNETATDFAAKLEQVATVDHVSVTRTGPDATNAFTWVITFEATRTQYEYGFFADVEGNLAPIQADAEGLSGSDARVVVQYAFGADDMDTLECFHEHGRPEPNCREAAEDSFLLEEDRPVMGKYGHETGAVYVFVKDGEQWTEATKIKASDGDSYDNFGYSVSVDNTTAPDDSRAAVLAVGAPFTQERGEYEQQEIRCKADSGAFQLQFRGGASAVIGADATANELKDAIESIVSIEHVTVVIGDGSLPASTPVCSVAAWDDLVPTTVTFNSPANGDMEILVPLHHSDFAVPLLFDSTAVPDGEGFRQGVVAVTETVKGTIGAKTTGDSGYVVGAVYVFEPTTANLPYDWTEKVRLGPADGKAGDAFGYSVTAFMDTIVVGAPEHDDGADGTGALYVFRKDADDGTWSQHQKLVVPGRQAKEHLGHCVALYGHTIVAGAPGFQDNTGTVYVFKRLSFEHNFVFDQAVTPAESVPGDRVGTSVAIDLDTIATGAERADVDRKGVTPPAGSQLVTRKAGAVYVFTRQSYIHTYSVAPEQKLVANEPVAGGRFGHAVALRGDIVVVTEQEEYKGPQYPRKEVQSIRTFAASTKPDGSPNVIGNLFAVTWRRKQVSEEVSYVEEAHYSAEPYTNHGIKKKVVTGVFENVQTEWMENHVTAHELRKRLMDDLGTGLIQVDRQGPDDQDGYTWIITFLDIEGEVPKFGVVNNLTGHNAQVVVSVLKSASSSVYGMGHLFKREGTAWTQHAIVRPESYQSADLFGASCAVHDRYTAIGANNRDSLVTGRNGGAVYMFDIGFMNLRFANLEMAVLEDVAAGAMSIRVQRCTPACVVGTGDFTERIAYATMPSTATSQSSCLVNSAGTRECLWSPSDDHVWPSPTGDKGRAYAYYDSRGTSDFAPGTGHLVFLPSETSTDFTIVITNDNVHEFPDEHLFVLLQSPGMRPVRGGDLWAAVTIQDDGDGGVGVKDYLTKLASPNLEAFAHFGEAVSIKGDIAVVGTPRETVNGLAEAGAVYIFRRTSGVWELERRLQSEAPSANARYGTSVDLHAIGTPRMVVGEPASEFPAAWVYTRWAGGWVLETRLSMTNLLDDPRCRPEVTNGRCNNEHLPENKYAYFGGPNAVAIYDRFVAVGARGLETVFLYQRRGLDAEPSWTFYQLLRSSDYFDMVYPENSEHRKVYITHTLFGGAVDLTEDTVIVGAELEVDDHVHVEVIPDAAKALSCADAGFTVRAVEAGDHVRHWSLNTYQNAYIWDDSGTNTDAFPLPELSCEDTNTNWVTVKTIGVPDHPFGSFPLDVDTMRTGVLDNEEVVQVQDDLVFRLPRNRNVTNINPRSVLDDITQLPQGIIGIALNGIPFLNPFDEHGDDTVDVKSIGFRGNMADFCNGAPKSTSKTDLFPRLKGLYGYRTDPVCLYDDAGAYTTAAYGANSVPAPRTGEFHHFTFGAPGGDPNPNVGQRSALIGYALDGFPIYGPFDEHGNLPSDLDRCNGRFDSALGYVYHITPHRKPYLIGCFRGSPYVTTPDNDSPPFPHAMPDRSLTPARITTTYRGSGAVYTFVRRAITANDSFPDKGGLKMSPIGVNDSSPAMADGYAFFQHTKLLAADSAPGDRFGHAIAIQDEQILVGAYKDRAHARSTWDFETGDLRGWYKTGTAFDHQPTYGDNSLARNVYGKLKIHAFRGNAGEFFAYRDAAGRYHAKTVYEAEVHTPMGPLTEHKDHPIPAYSPPSELRQRVQEFVPGEGQSAQHRGRWWIGTFENRPGVQHNNGTVHPHQPAGNTQGDEPQGTLTSEPFQIEGTKISFLVGGGCDIRTEYVELLVDSRAVLRATGECEESMRRVTWHVAKYKWQSARIRIVDASSERWAHINVDDFRFNWHESYRQRSTTPSSDGTDRRNPAGGAVGWGGEPEAGAVYAFELREAESDEVCERTCSYTGCVYRHVPPLRWPCRWVQQQKLLPSDRRAGDVFGWALDLDLTNNMAVVAAYRGRAVDDLNNAVFGGKSQSGGFYVFNRIPPLRRANGQLLEPAIWPPVEALKLQAPDKGARDFLGFSVAISDHYVLAGAPTKSTPPGGSRAALTAEDGAAYVINVEYAHIRFSQKEFVILENDVEQAQGQSRATISVVRSGDLSGTLHVHFHTSDITALGISDAKTAYCVSLRYDFRGASGCGDYTHAEGIITFNPGDVQRDLYVFTMNDDCFERYPEYVGVHLGVPGGDTLIGEQFNTVLRIDDDDFGLRDCTVTKAQSDAYPMYPQDEEPDTRGTPRFEEPIPLSPTQRWILDNL